MEFKMKKKTYQIFAHAHIWEKQKQKESQPWQQRDFVFIFLMKGKLHYNHAVPCFFFFFNLVNVHADVLLEDAGLFVTVEKKREI